MNLQKTAKYFMKIHTKFIFLSAFPILQDNCWQNIPIFYLVKMQFSALRLFSSDSCAALGLPQKNLKCIMLKIKLDIE